MAARVALLLLGMLLLSASGGRARPPASVSICGLQGAWYTSLYAGETVRTQGVVFADYDETPEAGFFMQAPGCDQDPFTSDGIFVSLGSRRAVVSEGDLVEVTGVLRESFGRTELDLSAGSVTILAVAQPLPVPVELTPPTEPTEAERYWEAHEGMNVTLSEARVVGPTTDDAETWLVPAVSSLTRVFAGDPFGEAQIVCALDTAGISLDPPARAGERVSETFGPLDLVEGRFCIRLLHPPVVWQSEPTALPPLPEPAPGLSFTLATVNLANLFDTTDDPYFSDPVLSVAEYQRRLQKRALLIHAGLGEPLLIAVQEAENRAVLQALVNRAEIETQYEIVHFDTVDERGLDQGLLYRAGYAEVWEAGLRQGCTRLVDGLGPDGNQDVRQPVNAVTCDTDGDGALDGNRLFSRPPLAVRLRVCPQGCVAFPDPASPQAELWVIANHWKSQVEDTPLIAYTSPRRLEQAQFVAGLLAELRAAWPGVYVIILGDLNDGPASPPLAALQSAGVWEPLGRIPPGERYTYVFEGRSEVLDHILLSPNPGLSPVDLRAVHVNADFPDVYAETGSSFYRSSDHDPLLVHLHAMEHFLSLPICSKSSLSPP